MSRQRKRPFADFVKARHSMRRSALSALLLSTLPATPGVAATVIWDGDGPTSAWSAFSSTPTSLGVTNWVGSFVLPHDDDSLQFAGTRTLANTNTHLSSVRDLIFNAGAGAFVLGGNALSVYYEVDNRSSNLQTIDLALTATGRNGLSQGVDFWGATGGLRINGAFTAEDGISVYLRSNVQIENAGRNLVFGNAGSLLFSVGENASINSRSLRLGAQATGSGNLGINGSNARLTTADQLIVGDAGAGHFTLSNGAVSTNLFASLAAQAGSSATATIMRGAEWHVTRALYVGKLGNASMTVKQDGAVFSDEGWIGFDGGAGGSVQVSTGGRWSVNATLGVGTATGDGTLDILEGGLVSARLLSIGENGVVRLAGGELALEDFSAIGRLDWTSGTLTLTRPGGAAMGAGPLANAVYLGANMHLKVNESFTVGAGTVLVLNGGTVHSGGLTLSGGTIVAFGAFDPSSTGGLTGHGVVAGPVTGGAGARIRADGTLTLGDAANAGGFDFDGELDVGYNQVVLLASGKAGLGMRTRLDSDSRLNVPNGAFLANGRTLEFAGNATVLGHFVNAGSVSGSSGTLTFLNDVTGPGSFAGDIVFHAGYSPGESPAIVDFGGGNASFDPTSVLTMELFGPAPGTQHDQLVNIDHLQFDGRLHLVFGSGFLPGPGVRLSLFDYQSFSGSLSADRIDVEGIDRSRLDLSRLSVDGTIAAVPEPAEWMLIATGAVLVAWRGQRRRSEGKSATGAGATI